MTYKCCPFSKDWLRVMLQTLLGARGCKFLYFLVPGRACLSVLVGVILSVFRGTLTCIFPMCSLPCSAVCIEPFFVFQTVEAPDLLLLRGSLK